MKKENSFVENNDNSRIDFIKSWSKKIRKFENWRGDHQRFINSQIYNAREFYDKLLLTKDGDKKIIKLFGIGNKNIIKRLSMINNGSTDRIKIIKENKVFIKV